MSYLLRNDPQYTVRVGYESGSYVVQVHRGLDELVNHESARSEDCVEIAQRFVDHHISSRVLWALTNDVTAPPLIRPKSAAYTEDCRQKVEALYK
jgi:hypothetical protein